MFLCQNRLKLSWKEVTSLRPCLGHDGHGGGAGLYPPLRFRGGHTLHAVHASLPPGAYTRSR